MKSPSSTPLSVGLLALCVSLAPSFLVPFIGGAPNSALALPPDFFEETIASGWNEPVGLTFDANGRMFVWERGGTVWTVVNGVKSAQPFLDISEEVGGWRDYGMLGFALHPNFLSNGHFYVFYVVDRHHLMFFGTPSYDPNANNYFSATIGRLTRYTATAASNYTTVDLASRTIFIGTSPTDGVPILHQTHGTGELLFGDDGTLILSTGDAGSYNGVDNGGPTNGGYVPQALADGIIKPKEDVGAYRSQLIDCLDGKILRMDPDTGEGLPSNPYFDPLAPSAPRSLVWSIGLRNPYRVSLRPETGSHNRTDGDPGTLYIGDVGWNKWEELNVASGPGDNFGWPHYEGLEASNEYGLQGVLNLDAPNPLFGSGGCTQEYFSFDDLIIQDTLDPNYRFPNPCDTQVDIPSSIPTFVHSRPILDWRHGTTGGARTGIFNGNDAGVIQVGAPGSPVAGSPFQGNAATAGVWYTGDDFPPQYKNTFFFGDFGRRWLRVVRVDANDNPYEVELFDSGRRFVYGATHPTDGGLYIIDWDTNEVLRIFYSPTGNQPPVAVITSDAQYGSTPLTVNFTGDGSSDPEQTALTYLWDFGDGSPTSTLANPSHQFTAPPGVPTTYTVTLTVTDSDPSDPRNGVTTYPVFVNNTPPAVTITSPIDNSLYPLDGDTLYDLTATISDAEHSAGELTCSWRTYLFHNDHEHAEPLDPNCTTTSVISAIGCDGNVYYYRITLTVTDAEGLSTTEEVRIYPDCSGTLDPPPVATVTAPTANGLFRAGDVINYGGTGTDNGGTPLPDSAYSWTILWRSGAQVSTIAGPINGVTGGSFTVPTTGLDFAAVTSIDVQLAVTDANGTDVDTVSILPDKATLSLDTSPAGLDVTVGGAPNTAPFSDGFLIDAQVDIGAPDQTIGQTNYTFNSWSDAGAQTHTVVIPASGDSLVATFDSSTIPPPSGNLVAAWSFDEGSGSVAADASGNGNDGTISGALWNPSGRNGAALEFDGVDDFVLVPDSNSLDVSTEITMSAWVYPTSSLSGWNCIVQKETDIYFLHAASTGGNAPTAGVQIGSTPRFVKGPSPIPIGQWSHIAGTYDGTTIRVFVDGVEVASSARSGPIANSAVPLRLGGNTYASEFFPGLLDDIRIYSSALSAAEIQADMNTPVGGPPTPDTTPPTVTVTSPVSGATVNGITTVNADASDNVGVVGVQFLLDGNDLGAEDTTAPYFIDWDTTTSADGAYVLSVIARDAAGNTTMAVDVPVTVDNTVPNQAPIVSAGADLATDTGLQTTISGSASDDGLPVPPGSVAVLWTAESGPGTPTWPLNDQDSAVTNVVFPVDGVYVLRLTADDGELTAFDEVTVTVQVPTVATPGFNPNGGTFVSQTSATISTTTAGASIYYTTDGSTPDQTSTLYTAAITLTATTTVQARAYAPGHNPSAVAAATFTEVQPPSDLVLAMSFDEGAGTTANDSSGEANHGTLQGATWTTEGRFGSALLCDGSNDIVLVPDSDSLDVSSGMTLSAWVYPTASMSGWKCIMQKETDTYFLHASSSGGNPAVGATIGFSQIRTQKGSFEIPINAWSHIAGTFDGANMRLYVDGVEVGSRALAGSVLSSTTPLRIGGNTYSSEFFPGRIDELRIYKRALTPAEIQADMANGIGGGSTDTTPPTVTLTAPTGGATLTGTVAVTADASDDVGVAGVQFLLDGNNLGLEDTTAPYSISWDTTTAANGPYVLSAIARDAAGNTATATDVLVNVDNPPPNTAPVANAGADLAGVVGTTLQIVGSATDDGLPAPPAALTYQWTLVSGPGTPTWPLNDDDSATTHVDFPVPGVYVLRLTADDSDLSGSDDVSVSVTAAPDNTAPTVTLTAPTAGATVSDSVSVTADATDNVGVVGVQFLLDGADLGAEDTSAPYAVSWDTTAVLNGSYVLSARARDAAGNLGTATDVAVTVDNPNAPPIVSAGADLTTDVNLQTTISGSATDDGRPIVPGSISVLWTAQSGPGTPTWPLNDQDSTVTNVVFPVDGVYVLRLTADDGELTALDEVTVTVQVPPTATPTFNPDGGTFVSQTSVTISTATAGASIYYTTDGSTPDQTSTLYTAAITLTATTTVQARAYASGFDPSAVAAATFTEVQPPSDLVLAMSFDEGAGTTANDSSGEANHGTLQGATWTTEGRFGSALLCDGSNDIVLVQDSDSLDVSSGMTLSAWVYPTASMSGWKCIMQKETDIYFLHASSSGGNPAVGATVGFSQIRTQKGSFEIPINAWSHIAGTFDGANMRLYVDGVEVGSRALTGSVLASTTPLRIGGNTYSNEFFPGRIDELRIYKRALTPAEIQADMANGIGGGSTDTTPPTVTLTAPTGGATLTGTVAVTADASDDVGVAGVQFLLDGNNLGLEDTTAPYSISWDTTTAANGPYVLSAIARDAAGNTATATDVLVNVDNPPPNTAPVANAGADLAGVVGTTLQIVGSATDDGLPAPPAALTYQWTLVSGPGTPTWPLNDDDSATTHVDFPVPGVYVLRLTADDSDLSGSDDVSVSVTAAPDNTAPTVTLTAPTAGATVSDSVSVTADATDNVGVVGVQFLLDGADLGAEDTSAPYAVSWDTTAVLNGSYVLSARARDAAGNLGTATDVAVTVDNPNAPPIVSAGADLTTDVNLQTTISGSATDDGRPIVPGSISVLWTAQSGPGTPTWPLNDQDSAVTNVVFPVDGVYVLRLTADDGELTALDEVTVTVQLPTVATPAFNPSGGTFVGQTSVTISTATAGASIYYTTDGSTPDQTSTPYTAAITLTATTTVQARAYASGFDPSAVAAATFTEVQPPSDLVLAMSFDEGSGITATDSSGEANDGDLQGAAWTTEGRFGNAVTFDGINDIVLVPDSDSLDVSTGMTLSAWVYPTASMSGWKCIAQKEVNTYFLHASSSGGNPAVGATFGFNSVRTQKGSFEIPINAWSHVAGTYDGANLRLYIDGVEVGSRTQTGNIANSSTPLRIGGNTYSSEFFPGRIDELRIYKRALSASEIQTDMTVGIGLAGPVPPSVTITSPAEGASITSDTVTVDFGVSGDQSNVSDVQLTLDANPPVTVNPAVGTYDFTGVPIGAHTVVAQLLDLGAAPIAGATDSVNFTTAEPDTTDPTVSITSPADGAQVTGIVTATATASDNVGVVGVQFQLDGSDLGVEDTTSPYSAIINTSQFSSGLHTLSAVARDAAGNTALSSITLDFLPNNPSGLDLAIQNMQGGEWLEIPNSHMRDVAYDNPNDPRGDIGGIMGAASGGTYDTTRDRLIIWGGGPSYSGNEIYVFDMNLYQWIRLNDPTPWPAGEEGNPNDFRTYPDGSPVARHSYDAIEYMPPPVDRLLVPGGAAVCCNGNNVDFTTYTFDFDTLTWTPLSNSPSASIGSVSAVGADGRLWHQGGGNVSNYMSAYAVSTDTWTQYAKFPTWYGYKTTGAVDPSRDLFVSVGGGHTTYWNLDTPANAGYRVTTTGDTSIKDIDSPGLDYHPVADRMVAWGGGTDVYTLNLDTNVWTRVPTTGSVDPGAQSFRGTFGRFRYVPSKDIFVVVNSVDTNVFVYRLP